MNYKYPPIYKYGALLITIYMLLKHQKIMTSDKILTNSLIITIIFAVFDHILIEKHPTPFENKKESFEQLFEENDDDDKIINSFDTSILNELDDEDENSNDYLDGYSNEYNIRDNTTRHR